MIGICAAVMKIVKMAAAPKHGALVITDSSGKIGSSLGGFLNVPILIYLNTFCFFLVLQVPLAVPD